MAARQQLSDVSTHNHTLFEKVQNFENEIEQMSKIRELNDQERVTIADERNAISDRAIQLESEIIEHIQGMGLSPGIAQKQGSTHHSVRICAIFLVLEFKKNPRDDSGA